MTMLATAGALAASALAGGSAEKFDPPLGLAFRFTVRIGGLDLGGWESCKGLKVQFSPFPAKAGGQYLTTRNLPGEVNYNNVTLTRAVVEKHSKKLQTWLEKQASKWIAGEAAPGVTATIAMFDAYGDEVMIWTLANVRPASWSGPDLDAKASKIGIESLELAHEGFTVKVDKKTFGELPSPPDAQRPAVADAAIPTLALGGTKVQFPFPPTELGVSRTSEKNQPLISTTDAPAASKSDVTQYELKGMNLEGRHVQDDIKTLTEWASKVEMSKPAKGGAGGGGRARSNSAPASSKAGGNQTAYTVLPKLDFAWGQLTTKVTIATLTVTYKRFLKDGTPVRATVTLKLDEAPSSDAKGAKNPTSGGPPGRAAHVLTSADTLPALARDHLGHAGSWRTLAESNEIHDPLRVRPGARIYLPAPDDAPKLGAGVSS